MTSTWTDKTSLRQTVSVVNTTPEQKDRARRFTATQAKDAEDCALLLSALGLGPVGGEWT
jgi:hypothetical protein